MLDQLPLRIDRIPQLSMKFSCWRCCTLSDRAPSPKIYQIILIVVHERKDSVINNKLSISYRKSRRLESQRKAYTAQFGGRRCSQGPISQPPYNHREEICSLTGHSRIHSLTQGKATLAHIVCLQFKAASTALSLKFQPRTFSPVFPGTEHHNHCCICYSNSTKENKDKQEFLLLARSQLPAYILLTFQLQGWCFQVTETHRKIMLSEILGTLWNLVLGQCLHCLYKIWYLIARIWNSLLPQHTSEILFQFYGRNFPPISPWRILEAAER